MEGPATLAWELGNELHDLHYGVERLPNSPVPPREWTADIAATLKAWDANHWLVNSGGLRFPISSGCGRDRHGGLHIR